MMPETPTRSLKLRGDIDGVLAGERIRDEQCLVRLGEALDLGDFGHQPFIDVLAAGGIEDDDVVAADAGGRDGALGDVDRTLAEDDRERGDAGLLAEHLQLLHGGRTIDVERRHQHALLVAVLEEEGELGRRGGLARALEPDHEDGRRRRTERERFAFGTQHADEGVVDDLHDLLAGRDRADHRFADRLFAHLGDEILDHGERDVGVDESFADLGKGGIDIGLGQRAATAQPVEHRTQTLLQAVEHLEPRILSRLGRGEIKARTPQGAHLRCLGAIPDSSPGPEGTNRSGWQRFSWPCRFRQSMREAVCGGEPSSSAVRHLSCWVCSSSAPRSG